MTSSPFTRPGSGYSATAAREVAERARVWTVGYHDGYAGLVAFLASPPRRAALRPAYDDGYAAGKAHAEARTRPQA